MAEGIRQGGESVVNTLLLPNAHPQLIPAISMTTQPPAGARWACWSSIPSPRPLRPPMWPPSSQRDPDRGAHWIRHRRQGFVTLTGDVGAVREAVAAASRDAELLVGTSFLVIQTIVNTFGVTASAGVGVAEKVCVFLMLVPSAYMHSMSAFVAQNMGAASPAGPSGRWATAS